MHKTYINAYKIIDRFLFSILSRIIDLKKVRCHFYLNDNDLQKYDLQI